MFLTLLLLFCQQSVSFVSCYCPEEQKVTNATWIFTPLILKNAYVLESTANQKLFSFGCSFRQNTHNKEQLVIKDSSDKQLTFNFLFEQSAYIDDEESNISNEHISNIHCHGSTLFWNYIYIRWDIDLRSFFIGGLISELQSELFVFKNFTISLENLTPPFQITFLEGEFANLRTGFGFEKQTNSGEQGFKELYCKHIEPYHQYAWKTQVLTNKTFSISGWLKIDLNSSGADPRRYKYLIKGFTNKEQTEPALNISINKKDVKLEMSSRNYKLNFINGELDQWNYLYFAYDSRVPKSFFSFGSQNDSNFEQFDGCPEILKGSTDLYFQLLGYDNDFFAGVAQYFVINYGNDAQQSHPIKYFDHPFNLEPRNQAEKQETSSVEANMNSAKTSTSQSNQTIDNLSTSNLTSITEQSAIFPSSLQTQITFESNDQESKQTLSNSSSNPSTSNSQLSTIYSVYSSEQSTTQSFNTQLINQTFLQQEQLTKKNFLTSSRAIGNNSSPLKLLNKMATSLSKPGIQVLGLLGFLTIIQNSPQQIVQLMLLNSTVPINVYEFERIYSSWIFSIPVPEWENQTYTHPALWSRNIAKVKMMNPMQYILEGYPTFARLGFFNNIFLCTQEHLVILSFLIILCLCAKLFLKPIIYNTNAQIPLQLRSQQKSFQKIEYILFLVLLEGSLCIYTISILIAFKTFKADTYQQWLSLTVSCGLLTAYLVIYGYQIYKINAYFTLKQKQIHLQQDIQGFSSDYDQLLAEKYPLLLYNRRLQNRLQLNSATILLARKWIFTMIFIVAFDQVALQLGLLTTLNFSALLFKLVVKPMKAWYQLVIGVAGDVCFLFALVLKLQNHYEFEIMIMTPTLDEHLIQKWYDHGWTTMAFEASYMVMYFVIFLVEIGLKILNKLSQNRPSPELLGEQQNIEKDESIEEDNFAFYSGTSFKQNQPLLPTLQPNENQISRIVFDLNQPQCYSRGNLELTEGFTLTYEFSNEGLQGKYTFIPQIDLLCQLVSVSISFDEDEVPIPVNGDIRQQFSSMIDFSNFTVHSAHKLRVTLSFISRNQDLVQRLIDNPLIHISICLSLSTMLFFRPMKNEYTEQYIPVIERQENLNSDKMQTYITNNDGMYISDKCATISLMFSDKNIDQMRCLVSLTWHEFGQQFTLTTLKFSCRTENMGYSEMVVMNHYFATLIEFLQI